MTSCACSLWGLLTLSCRWVCSSHAAGKITAPAPSFSSSTSPEPTNSSGASSSSSSTRSLPRGSAFESGAGARVRQRSKDPHRRRRSPRAHLHHQRQPRRRTSLASQLHDVPPTRGALCCRATAFAQRLLRSRGGEAGCRGWRGAAPQHCRLPVPPPPPVLAKQTRRGFHSAIATAVLLPPPPPAAPSQAPNLHAAALVHLVWHGRVGGGWRACCHTQRVLERRDVEVGECARCRQGGRHARVSTTSRVAAPPRPPPHTHTHLKCPWSGGRG